MLVTHVGDDAVVDSPSSCPGDSVGFASFPNGNEVHPPCGLFVENTNIPDSVVDNAQGFVDNHLAFVNNDDDAILYDNVEEFWRFLCQKPWIMLWFRLRMTFMTEWISLCFFQPKL
jgi:hypothetical protein